MAITDLITLCLSIFFVIRGASRGFMNSLLGPFSLIVATIASIAYFQATKDVVVSLIIGLIGPLLLTLLLKFVLKTWVSVTDSKTKPSSLSRWGGSILTLIWGWVFIIFTLILLAVFPPWGEALTGVHHDVTKSISYAIAKPWKEILFAGSKQNSAAVTKTPSGTDEKSLAEDPRFKKILQDPEIQKEVDAHDIVKLMSNPKMMELTKEIMNDPAAMKKVLAVYSSQKQPQQTTP